jgi:putative transposase
VRTMCRLLGVYRSGNYAWRSRPPSANQIADAELTRSILRIHEASRGTYGRPRVEAELWYEASGARASASHA